MKRLHAPRRYHSAPRRTCRALGANLRPGERRSCAGRRVARAWRSAFLSARRSSSAQEHQRVSGASRGSEKRRNRSREWCRSRERGSWGAVLASANSSSFVSPAHAASGFRTAACPSLPLGLGQGAARFRSGSLPRGGRPRNRRPASTARVDADRASSFACERFAHSVSFQVPASGRAGTWPLRQAATSTPAAR